MNARFLRLRSAFLGSTVTALVIGLWAWPTGAAYGQAKWPESYRGVWSGAVTQGPNSYPSYICLLGGALGDTVGTITYRVNPGIPDWNIGLYRLDQIHDDYVFAREIITDGNPSAVDGPARLGRWLGEDQLAYSWTNDGGCCLATGTYTRLTGLADILPDSYRSIWEGSISNNTGTRRVRLTLAGGDIGSPVGVVDYPDSGGGCGGLVTLESIDKGSIQLSEAIDYGSCGWAEAHLTLSKTPTGTVDLRWEGAGEVFSGKLSDPWCFLLCPTASIDVVGPDAQGSVQLSAAKSTTPAGTEPLTFAWELGDGTTATDATMEHPYASGVYSVRLTVTNAAGASDETTTSVTVPCTSAVLPPWGSSDLGTPLVPGGARMEDTGAGSCWTLCAGGRGFRSTVDEGHFLHQEVEGDFVLTAEVDDLQNAGASSQAGLMARDSSDASDPSARQGSLLALGNGNIAAVRRRQPNQTATQNASSASDRWLRLERRGSTVIGSHSPDGAQWTPLDAPLLDGIVAAKIFVGLAASPRVSATLKFYPAMEARFCQVQLEHVGSDFRRGDPNGDGKADISDAIVTLGFLFLGNPTKLACDKSADSNDDGKLDLSDPVALLNHLFVGAPAPPEPFRVCGADATADELSCEASGPCA